MEVAQAIYKEEEEGGEAEVRKLNVVCRVLSMVNMAFATYLFSVLRDVQGATYFMVLGMWLWIMGGEDE